MMFLCSNKISAASDDLALDRDLLVWATMAAHQSRYMLSIQLQGKCLGSLVARIDDTRDMHHLEDTSIVPFLYAKVLYVDMTGLQCGLVVINHVHRGLVIDVENGRPYFLKTMFLKGIV
jgi:hypothetical protein